MAQNGAQRQNVGAFPYRRFGGCFERNSAVAAIRGPIADTSPRDR
jgi:hypothetical protein